MTEQTKLAGMLTKYLDRARSGRRFRTSRSLASAPSFGRSAASGAGFGGKVIFIKLKSRRGVARAFSGKIESGRIPKEARIRFNIPTGTRGPVVNGEAILRRPA